MSERTTLLQESARAVADEVRELQSIIDAGRVLREGLQLQVSYLQKRCSALEAAIETAGYIFRDTDSGPNLVKP